MVKGILNGISFVEKILSCSKMFCSKVKAFCSKVLFFSLGYQRLGRPSWFSDHNEIFRLFVMWILDQAGDASTLRIVVKN